MSLNQGIQKYRESVARGKGGAQAKKAAAKTPAKENPSKDGKDPKKPGEVVEAAADEAKVQEETAREEAALQKEIAEELERDAATTSKLVKEDCSPVNSSRDQLILEYSPLIKYIAQKIAARLPANIELDDLMSSGVIGLMDAIDKYDATRDNKFKTYAEFRIRGAILDELRAQDWVPRSVREKAKQLERCYTKIEQQKGRQATDEEVCEELGISQDEYHDMLNQVRSVSLLSFDDISSFSKTDKRTMHGYGSENGPKMPTPFNEVNSACVKKIVADAIRELPEKQRLVLSLYYYEDLNLKEIGRVLDVTESRVSQLHTQAILRLKAKLRNHWDDFVAILG
jgi:RNA polymerase sigma factor for flagellar operon FliA